MKKTLICTLQNRLGALDRVLGTMTHWGFLPERLQVDYELQQDCLKLSITFECPDNRTLDKLMRYLQKQVYVMTICQIPLCIPDRATETLSTSIPVKAVPMTASPHFVRLDNKTQRSQTYAYHNA